MNEDELFHRIAERMSDPKARAEAEANEKKADEERKATTDRIIEQMVGIKPEHSDPIYTQHPVMAGVIRAAMRRAYDEGANSITRRMMDEMLSARARGRR